MYSSVNDIKDSIAESELLKLLKDSPNYSSTMTITSEDEARINKVLAEVADLMDTFLRPRYSTPYPGNSSVLKEISNEIAIIRIHQFREKFRRALPDSMRKDLQAAMEKLTLIREGKLLLETPKSPARRQYRTSCRTRVWTEESLDSMP